MSENSSDRRRRRKPQFNPGRLFANGEQGAWYDPSDFSTLYQDSAGTTPVTALGQPVGLMLDKSQGAAPGPELVDINALPTPGISGFGGSSGAWDAGTRTMSNTAIGSDNTYPRFGFDLGMTAGKRYMVSGRLSGDIANLFTGRPMSLAAFGGANDIGYSNVTGVFYGVQEAAGSSLYFLFDGTNISDITIEEISVREIPGNHASQSTSAARPTVQARANLLTYTEAIEDYATNDWLQNRTLITADTGPSGVSGAAKLVATSASGSHEIYQNISLAASTEYTISVTAKAAGYNFLALNIYDGASSHYTFYNLATGGIETTGAGATATISDVGDGWYRCAITVTTSSSGTPNLRYYVTNADNVLVFTGDDTSGILVYGPQLERNSTATTYQRVTTATDYEDIGLPRYLEFDGVDDGMHISGLSAPAGPVYLGVGLRSNASPTDTIQFIFDVETDRLVASHPALTGNTVGAYDGVWREAALPVQVNYAMSFKYYATDGGVRANGSDFLTFSATELALGGGVGMAANYLVLSQQFNGNIYQFIVRAATTSGALLDNVERFIANKTGVTL